mmetsp:Transcript_5429/g.6770  ORF Transcript_5429/g.6770 Transcript_5429/m.6770 type:complete len:402 (-) Transcript_5429:109-1314(-)|eukprot:CAMPEP_0172506874 /NCGR_PEP_ID=MMETSP1066-20121228/199167_1 /TAXON_ID=671091 /ORGANISM="Coscinodiscus wailesii, Strain CCMP2513" /LENGTH=401 /DNA_ID=CAMNT_0013284137 /DNA_START=154 /DNA_END=1359 /DNA_ORIENTATION=+
MLSRLTTIPATNIRGLNIHQRLHRLIAPRLHHRALTTSSTTPPSSPPDFKPRRRPSKTYRPIPIRPRHISGPLDPDGSPTYKHQPPILLDPENLAADGGIDDDLLSYYGDFTIPSTDKYDDDGLASLGPGAADVIRDARKERERGGPTSIESELRLADYLTAEAGSTEDLAGERRLLAEAGRSEEERREIMAVMDEIVEEHRFDEFDLGNDDLPEVDPAIMGLEGTDFDPRRLVYGDWGESVVKIDRVQKVQRGGTMVRYRCLVIGGNARGVAGFGVGKSIGPKEAAEVASRKCKQNVFFLDQHYNQGLVHDCVGKHNSCKVILRAVSKGHGLKAHSIIEDILAYFGVSDCSAKSHGNRNLYNIVYATFKALMTHQSVETIAMRRGRRYLNLDRARRLQFL